MNRTKPQGHQLMNDSIGWPRLVLRGGFHNPLNTVFLFASQYSMYVARMMRQHVEWQSVLASAGPFLQVAAQLLVLERHTLLYRLCIDSPEIFRLFLSSANQSNIAKVSALTYGAIDPGNRRMISAIRSVLSMKSVADFQKALVTVRIFTNLKHAGKLGFDDCMSCLYGLGAFYMGRNTRL